MRRPVTFLVWLFVAISILGCSDHPVIGQRVAGAQGRAADTAAEPSPVARRLMHGAEALFNGFPSHDGRTWVHMNEGSILIRDLATGQDRAIVPRPSGRRDLILPRFSPDGTKIEYLEDIHDAPYRIWVRTIGLDGTGGTTLHEYKPESEDVGVMTWSRDGAYLVTIDFRSPGINRIGIASVRDGRAWALKTFDWRMPDNISFSSDGRFLAYDFPPDEKLPNRDIFVIATDGARETTVAADRADERLLGWTPGGGIMFSSDRAGTPAVYVASVADGRSEGPPQLVKNDFFRVSHSYGVTENGSLYYQVQPTARDVFTMTLDPATLRVLVPPAPVGPSVLGENDYPQWSWDGRFVAFVSYPVPRRSGGQRIVIRPVDAGEPRLLNPEMNYIGPIKWMPDGRSFVAAGEDPQTRPGLFRIDAQTGRVTSLRRVDQTRGVRGTQKVEISRDGRTAFLSVQVERAEWAFIAFDLETKTEREVRRFPAVSVLSQMFPSPDGTQLVFATSDTSSRWRLFTMAVEGGDPREVYRAPDDRVIGGGTLNWMADRHVLFVTRERAASDEFGMSGTEQFVRVPLDGGPVFTSDLKLSQNVAAPRAHPDGRRFVFESGLPSYEVWVLERAVPASRTSVSR